MPTRNINLTPYFDSYIENVVATGRYQNASEVVRDGLRLLEERERTAQSKMDAFLAAAKEGQDAFARGDFFTFDTSKERQAFMDDIIAEIEAKKVTRKTAK